MRWELVPVLQRNPACGDHLRQVEFILGPEFLIDRQQALAPRVELDQFFQGASLPLRVAPPASKPGADGEHLG